MPEFANPLALWALLGVPAVLAIHFLQQRSRTWVTSTLFLIAPLAPESRGGRTWERLRSSRSLWLQLLAVLLGAWLLAEPRWVRSESAQTIAVVLDASASMAPFRVDAERAVDDLLAAREDDATHTEWIVLTSDSRAPTLYRGTDRTAAIAAMSRWKPRLGVHDPVPALRLAHALAGTNGLTWLITHARAKVPTAQAAIGVGRPIDNVGFAGVSVLRDGEAQVWRALVQNHSDRPQSRSWWVQAGGARTAERQLDLPAGGLVELSGQLPDGLDRCTVVLNPDGFTLDDRLPLVRPIAKSLGASVEMSGETGAFFRRVLQSIDGVAFTAESPRLRVRRMAPDAPPAVVATIRLPEQASDGSGSDRILRAPVVVEKHALLEDLNWQGWLGPGPANFSRAPGDVALLWQSDRPLAWLTRGGDESGGLTLNFHWDRSNASRLPAAVLLVRRYVERLRDAQPGMYVANLDALERIPLAPGDLAGVGEVTLEVQPAAGGAPVASTVSSAELPVLRAPAEPAFFVLRRGEQVLMRGAAQFADPRTADFRAAERFATPPPAEAAALLRRNTRPDPLVPLWLVLIGLCLLGCWWPARRRIETTKMADEPALKRSAA